MAMPMPAADEQYEIIIVGGGPAGLATALHLQQRFPALAARTLILEAAQHPRRKICGGAVTAHGEAQLAALGLRVDVPAVTVDRVRFRYRRHAFTLHAPAAMRVVQRDAFDGALAAAAQARGLALRCGEAVCGVQVMPGGVALRTSHAAYHARVVVAADGANSTVRRALGLRAPIGVARLLRVMTPVDPAKPEFAGRAATFDFSCVAHGIQGYAWDFPCLLDGRPCNNRGIFDSRLHGAPRGDLKAVLARGLDERGIAPDGVRLEGHPVRWFNPRAAFAAPHVLLAGDAAGVDPLFAEGISYALEYGAVAADAIGAAYARGDWSFADYRARLLRHDLGRMLAWKYALARWLYGRRPGLLWGLVWRLAVVAPAWMQRRVGRALGVLPLA